MEFVGHFRRLTPVQRNTFIACFLGWSLDAFDFFILVLCVNALATQFHEKVSAITEAIFWTLAMRPVGAFLFGLLADRYGRRLTLMIDIIAYSVFELASAFAPSLKVFIIMRAFFGIAMGGEWGVGAALTFETLPAEGRGFFSGLLQEGYVVGYLLAALAYRTLFPVFGWRGMFVLGALPAFLVIYIRTKVEESPAWLQGRVARETEKRLGRDIVSHLGIFAFLVVLMFAFNSFSHGTQDLYPTFLERNMKFTPQTTGLIVIIYNLGALLGGILFGTWSERIGRRRAIIVAALLAIPVIPLWAYSHSVAMFAAGRLSDAVHGAGSVGSDSGAPERTVASFGARDVSRICLSTGQPVFVAECGDPGEVGGDALWRQLSAGAGLDGTDGCEFGRDRYGQRQGAAGS